MDATSSAAFAARIREAIDAALNRVPPIEEGTPSYVSTVVSISPVMEEMMTLQTLPRDPSNQSPLELSTPCSAPSGSLSMPIKNTPRSALTTSPANQASTINPPSNVISEPYMRKYAFLPPNSPEALDMYNLYFHPVMPPPPPVQISAASNVGANLLVTSNTFGTPTRQCFMTRCTIPAKRRALQQLTQFLVKRRLEAGLPIPGDEDPNKDWTRDIRYRWLCRKSADCNFVSQYPENLERHRRAIHDGLRYICRPCGTILSDWSNLKSHWAKTRCEALAVQKRDDHLVAMHAHSPLLDLSSGQVKALIQSEYYRWR